MEETVILSEIVRLKKIEQQIRELQAVREKCLRPLVNDLEMIGRLYRFVCCESPGDLCMSAQYKWAFTLVMLVLYAPASLNGGKMPCGFRAQLAQVLDVFPSTISDNRNNLLFRYARYRDFRQLANRIYRLIRNRLQAYGYSVPDTL